MNTYFTPSKQCKTLNNFSYFGCLIDNTKQKKLHP